MASQQLPELPQWAIDLQTAASAVVNEHGVDRHILDGEDRPQGRSFSGVIELLDAPKPVLLKEEALFHVHLDDLELATRSLDIYQGLRTDQSIRPITMSYSVLLEPIDTDATGEDRVEMEFDLNGVIGKGYQVNRKLYPHNGRLDSRTFSIKEAKEKGLLMKDLLPYIVREIVRERTRLEKATKDFVTGSILSIPPPEGLQ